MAGIYIHIPFCKAKCPYCNFFSTPSVKYQKEIINAIKKEVNIQKKYLQEEIKTIYFGGGTPSLLETDDIKSLIDCIAEHFEISSDVEITLEANPDDITRKKVAEWKQSMLNRISIGVQSFGNDDLQWLKRIHTAQQAEYAVKLLQDSNFTNLNVDLIYGVPTQNIHLWEQHLYKTIKLEVPHISCYGLTVEPKTTLDILIKKQHIIHPQEELAADQFRLTMNILKNNGYQHYEISNYCKSGMESKHNLSYWKNTSYLGFGPSAHSYNKVSRQWNCSSITDYLAAIEKNQIPFECEVLSEVQKFNEYLLTSLRTRDGIDLSYVKNHFGENYYHNILKSLETYELKGWIQSNQTIIKLTDEGKLFADKVITDFFMD